MVIVLAWLFKYIHIELDFFKLNVQLLIALFDYMMMSKPSFSVQSRYFIMVTFICWYWLLFWCLGFRRVCKHIFAKAIKRPMPLELYKGIHSSNIWSCVNCQSHQSSICNAASKLQTNNKIGQYMQTKACFIWLIQIYYLYW